MKLCFVSVNGPREPYLLDEPRKRRYYIELILNSSHFVAVYIYTKVTINMLNEMQPHEVGDESTSVRNQYAYCGVTTCKNWISVFATESIPSLLYWNTVHCSNKR
jgi:hypothetical protein